MTLSTTPAAKTTTPALRPAPADILPQPYRPLPPKAACPACAGGLVFSAAHAYVACPACGWQRRLVPGSRTRCDVALGASGVPVPWGALLARLAATDPDAVPPCPALLWEQVGPREWAGPSATAADVIYSVRYAADGTPHCSCRNGGRTCWHRHLVDARRAARPVPAWVVVNRGRVQDDAAAATDLFGPVAA